MTTCDNVPYLTWKMLSKSSFSFKGPFQLELQDGQHIVGDEVIRIIPKKRVVAFGTWKDKSVVVKIFFGPHAKEAVKKDVGGIKILQQNRIPTPALYYQGVSKDKRIHLLILQRIFNTKNLDAIWHERKNTDSMRYLLKAIVVELATQHVFGVLQHDLHLKNFLLTKKTIFTLDGSQIKSFPYPLPKKASMNNLALFLAQLGVGQEFFHKMLFQHYAKSRGWIIKKRDNRALRTLIKKWNVLRWQKYEKKIFRSSTESANMRNLRTVGMVERNSLGPEFDTFLKNPESVFQSGKAQLLKNGRSSTVIKINFDKRDYVIKRYNIKSFWHRLRRMLRPTRAYSAWRLAKKLELFDVATAKPIAFIEKRFLGFRGKSYFVTEYISGEHAGNYFARYHADENKIDRMIGQITALLKRLAKLEISHGDLKITNILINNHEQPILIDLDGTAEHISLPSLHRAWHYEIERFLKNFDAHPTIGNKFKLALAS